ncbi:MAG: hypothetical protein MK183_15435 [Verrucomicrobiales bacterium]|nr:hypothetical protein [Verrucomicrobiales bacterium]
MKTLNSFGLLFVLTTLLVVACGEKSLDSKDVQKLLEEAVDADSLQERKGLRFQINSSNPYTGWEKRMYDSGQARTLTRFKDGKPDGPGMAWYENGQKEGEGTWKDGKMDGSWTSWHDNGQRRSETTLKGNVFVSGRFWNRLGEEVETFEDTEK